MSVARRGFWAFPFAILTVYVAWRMQGFALWRLIQTPQGVQSFPNTFASVDHPFHVARASMLWQELGSGHVLRWIGQHQGGYPAEFYPLGQAWFEVVIRALSFDNLRPEGAHSLAVIALFLLPGAAYVALAKHDDFPPSVALLALAFQIGLPGGWYGGGYTELVQWGLVTNVAGATASIMVLPAIVSAMNGKSRRAAALAAGLAAFALYCNPRSAIGLAAIGLGALVAFSLSSTGSNVRFAVRRLLLIAATAGLLTAPLTISLLRFGDLYIFVRYSGYSTLSDYLRASVDSVSLLVFVAGLAGLVAAVLLPRSGLRAAAASTVLYIIATICVSFLPGISTHLQQLEPTRLMPLQRFLLMYLAAALTWTLLSGLLSRAGAIGDRAGAGVLAMLSIAIVALLTRPMFDEPPDPASPSVPYVSLYPVAMSAQSQQASLENAIVAADRDADPSTAILVLGSELSWHQQLWSPLWTERSLYYDNWLWYWHLDHFGTPEYRPLAGHHYPDPEAALTRSYLDRHGIGAVVASSALSGVANETSHLSRIVEGPYSVYLVKNPSPVVVLAPGETTFARASNSTIEAASSQNAQIAMVRENWFPRWSVQSDVNARIERTDDGAMRVELSDVNSKVTLVYAVQPLDVVARALAGLGAIVMVWLVFSRTVIEQIGAIGQAHPWGDL